MNAHAKIEEIASPEEIAVRVGVPDDVHRVMDVALMATDENGFVNPSAPKLLEHIWAALNLVDGICGIIGEPNGLVEGVVLLRIGSPWYSDDKILEEKAIFVHPDFRAAKGGRAKKLAEFSKSVRESLDLPLTIGVLSSERTEAKVRMYTRVFGKPSGAYWLIGCATGHHEREG